MKDANSENSQKNEEKNFMCQNPNHQVVGNIEPCCFTPQPESEGVEVLEKSILTSKLLCFNFCRFPVKRLINNPTQNERYKFRK